MILLSVMMYRVVFRFNSAARNARSARKTKNPARIVLSSMPATAGFGKVGENRLGMRRPRTAARVRASTNARQYRRAISRVDRVTFYHSDHAKSRDARAKVAEFCRGLGVPCTAVEVSDAYDLLQVAGQIRADVRKEKSAGTDLRFNIAGGTRLMSSAALLVCILEGIPATYVHDETYRELALPLLRMTYGEGLTRTHREAL